MKNIDSMPQKKSRSIVWDIVVVGALLAFILLSFFQFTRDNRARILRQNDSFIQAATEQKADQLDSLLDSSLQNVQAMAYLYGQVLDGPVVDSHLLQDIASRTGFDYVEFISRDGIDLTADGSTADLSDRDYFLDGMKGNAGQTLIYNSRITNETLLTSYAPFYHDGEILGVLSCILRGDTLMAVLDADYVGVQGTTYLLDRSGNVLLATNDMAPGSNLVETMSDRSTLTGGELQKLKDALDDANDVDDASFNYTGSSGEGSAYATVLHDGQWVLLQTLPSTVTSSMARNASASGIRLELALGGAFLVYVIYLILKNQLQKRQLVVEKQEVTRIVDAVTTLFNRFALVDYEANTYEYLKKDSLDLPDKGSYSDLAASLDGWYMDDGEQMSTFISQEYAREHLTEDVPYLQAEYQIDVNGPRWENISILCLKRENGVPVRVLYAIQDVTVLKEREQQIRQALKNASEAAEAANRAKSDFLARMSHDIRTPMNAIMGMTAVAAMHLDDPERLNDCLGKITISSRHLLALINDVLDMSKIESGKVTLSEEPFELANMVRSVVTIIQPQVNSKHQQLKVHITDVDHENVLGDVLRLQQVLVNILGNAVKFTPEEGAITFTIRECPSTVHGMGCYEFICQDTGVGMDEEFIKTIFEPFSRARSSVSQNIEGTGLGMSITRNIVQMMEGDIRVASQPGKGSTFTVQLHLKLQDAEALDVDALADLRVLVADDDPDSCTAAREILTSIGMRADSVLSGQEAVDRVAAALNTPDSYAVVILDWKMPGKDGVETAREIRELVGDQIPIIILSAFDWSDVEAEARRAGVQAFIEKPLFRSRLVFALNSVLVRDSEQADLAPEELRQSGFEGKRVLLVEDNELNREIALELLGFIGVDVEQAEDGQQAVDMVTEKPPHYYDLIFMDIQMPRLNGYEATRRIRALDREDAKTLPIIAMTANAFATDIREAQDAGMNDHIAKPVEVAKLQEALKTWL